MADFTPAEIDRRLEALYQDLERFPPGAPCPWPLARVFNDLLKMAKRGDEDDVIVRGMRLAAADADEPTQSDVAVGTVRGLIRQIRISMTSRDGAGPPSET